MIEEHYDEIVHLVCSLAEGAVSPDLVLKRVTSYSRKGGMHHALLDIGRAVQTSFVARYLEDPALRRDIHRNLCHGEAWNALTRISVSFNRALMRESTVAAQERRARALLLVQNMIVVWNVSQMRRAIPTRKKEGTACGRAELKPITPLLTSHLRMIPDFVIEFDRARNMTAMIAQPCSPMEASGSVLLDTVKNSSERFCTPGGALLALSRRRDGRAGARDPALRLTSCDA